MPTNDSFRFNFASLPAASTHPEGVDVWFLDLSIFTQKPHGNFSLFVTKDELLRATQFKHRASHFLATRALLRACLAHYTGINAQELVISREPQGKPFLKNTPVHFNLSHCEKYAVLAVDKNAVGVDIEIVNSRDYLKIAERYFHRDELQTLGSCTEAERGILFYKLWTLKEAFFKATGGGISSGLDKIAFHFDGEKINAKIAPSLAMHNNSWQFHQELIAPDAVVALVRNSMDLIQHQWLDGNALLCEI